MNTRTLSYTISAEQPAADLRELNIYDSTHLLNSIETQFASLEGGSNALATKSFRAARFSLIKQLANAKPLRVLSYEAQDSWANDIQIYKRYNITIVYADQFSEDTISAIIKSEKIDLVYIATIHSNTLAVNNHSFLISQAHSLQVPVIYNNTAGGLGSVYRPLTQEADYSIVDTSSFLGKSGIGAFVTEGFSKINAPTISDILNGSAIQILKNKRKNIRNQRWLLSDGEQSFEDLLNREVQKYKAFSKNTFTLAKWLNQVKEVAEVNYPGLKNSDYFLNAENNLRGGYANVLKFKLWDPFFSHNLLRAFFASGKNEDFTVVIDHVAREFQIEIRTESIHQVLAYFDRIFSQLSKELEYRDLLKKQIKLENEVRKIFLTHYN